MDPDDIFDLIEFPFDERVVTRMGEIRVALQRNDFSEDEKSGFAADVLACSLQVLAFLGATVEQAVAVAHVAAAVMHGADQEAPCDLNGALVSFEAGDRYGEYGESVVMLIDGRQLLSFEYVGTELEDLAGDWDAFRDIAARAWPAS
jgi:hypothetical protein